MGGEALAIDRLYQNSEVQSPSRRRGDVTLPLRKLLQGFGIAVLLLVVWELVVWVMDWALVVPPPTAIVRAVARMIDSGELAAHVTVSLQRVIVGYVIAAGGGIVLGIIMGAFRPFEALVMPPLQFVRSISPVAIVPLAIIWFGIGEASKYFVIAYSGIVPIILNTVAGVRSVPTNRIRAAECLGASRTQLLFRVFLPSAFGYIVLGLQTATGFAFMGVVAAELIGTNSGIGYLITEAQEWVQIDVMFVGLGLLAVIGFLLATTTRLLLNSTWFKRFSVVKE